MSTEKLTEEQINYLFMTSLSDWFNHSPRSKQEVLFALKYVSLGDNCAQCSQDRFSDPMRFPLSVDHEKEPMARANYRCHVCGHDWHCWWSRKEFVNTLMEDQ